MFASLKNKIREETGSDISKLTQKITSSTVQRIDSLRGRSSHGSTSSINSIVSSDGIREESLDPNRSEEEAKRKISRIENEFARKLEDKEREWREIVGEKDKRMLAMEREKEEALKQIANLKDSLRSAEEWKNKLSAQKEDKDQMETFQTQELAKVKRLVLLREQELAEKASAMKEMSQQLEKLRAEVTRLRRQEETLSDVQDDLESLRHSSARDLAALATELAKSEEERRHLTDLVAVLRQRTKSDNQPDDSLNVERKLLEQRLEEAHLHLADIKTSWSDKIASLETQVGRLSRQAAEEGAERRRAFQEKEALEDKVKQLECELECNRLELSNKETKIKRLLMDVEDLAGELKAVKAECEEEVTFMRTQILDANTEIKAVQRNLENSELELEKHEEECSRLRISVESEHQTNKSLRQMIGKLEKDLDDERNNSLNVQKTLTRVTSEKNAALLRNAEISQQMEIAKQETRRQGTEMSDLLHRIASLEEENRKFKEKEGKGIEQELRSNIAVLEDQIADKNKNIKTLQLRLADLKKTLQQELRTPSNANFYNDIAESTTAAILAPSQNSTKNLPTFTVRKDDEDVNFKYLKHVIIKFLTSREYEAQHLTRAVATLLKFSPEEEKLLNDTIEWRMSWFGSKPKFAKEKGLKAPKS